MDSFKNDYADGGHPEVLKALTETASIQTEGYGLDPFSEKAAVLIKKEMKYEDADIHFIAGGTLTNLTAIAAFLRPHEAVISPAPGHIAVHETGAIEATGHKIITVETEDGKINPDQIREVVREHHFEHMVKPKLVYISQSTEIGTIYSKGELTTLKELCEELGLYLYIDGARLGSALTAAANDLELSDLPELCDAFYIGGTKNGALFGEALVVCNTSLKQEFRYLLKQRGAMLAKGRIAGVQFIALFENGLYFDLAREANRLTEKLRQGIETQGYRMAFDSPTNQIFPVLPESAVSALEGKYGFYRWENSSAGMVTIRLICSWITEETSIDRFLEDLKAL